MITRRRPSARPATASPRFFAARMTQADEALLAQCQSRMAEKMGDRPSHPVLLHELLRAYIAPAA